MRKEASNDHVSVRAIAGTEVVLLGLNVPSSAAKTLLGFKIEKIADGKTRELNDSRTFKDTGLSLVQEFLWGDYSVDPDKEYTYKISAVHGSPDNMEVKKAISLKIKTEDPDDGEDAVYFNRGVAGSQAYSRHFDKHRRWFKTEPLEEDSSKIRFQEFLRPEDVPQGKAFKWLSRGLEEAMLSFIGQAKDKSYSIRASLYELSHVPAAQAFVDALERGADVKIIHHAKRATSYKLKVNRDAVTRIDYKGGTAPKIFNSKELQKLKVGDGVFNTAMRTVGEVGLKNIKNAKAFREMLISRTQTSISHNKFIILLKDGKPIQVWTGSTNVTGGGIFGQSNVGQIIRNEEIAAQYLDYWTKLSGDPKRTSTRSDPPETGMKNWVKKHNPDLKGEPEKDSVNAIFSPRLDTKMLQWYADRMKEAKESIFFTAAFSMDKRVLNVVKKDQANTSGPFQRYLLLEGITGLMRDKYPILKKCEQNRIAWGESMKTRKGIPQNDSEIETLAGLNDHVNFVHTKYLIIDALTDDPILISGSANFSEASTTNNDENMLIIRGNTRVTDMFLCEFMRLFNHFKRRNEANALPDEEFVKNEHLDSSSKWAKSYFKKGTQEFAERELFGKA